MQMQVVFHAGWLGLRGLVISLFTLNFNTF